MHLEHHSRIHLSNPNGASRALRFLRGLFMFILIMVGVNAGGQILLMLLGLATASASPGDITTQTFSGPDGRIVICTTVEHAGGHLVTYCN